MILEAGDVFLLRNWLLSGTEPHYHIVVQTTSDDKVVAVSITSNLEGAYKICRRDEDQLADNAEPMTYVELTPDDCPILKVKSAINCNQVQMKDESYYLNGDDFKKFAGVKTSPDILKRIRDGLQYSATVSPKIQKICKP